MLNNFNQINVRERTIQRVFTCQFTIISLIVFDLKTSFLTFSMRWVSSGSPLYTVPDMVPSLQFTLAGKKNQKPNIGTMLHAFCYATMKYMYPEIKYNYVIHIISLSINYSL